MNFSIEFEMEDDGRWIAAIPTLPGVMVYGTTKRDAESKVQVLALHVIADKLEQDSGTVHHLQFAAA